MLKNLLQLALMSASLVLAFVCAQYVPVIATALVVIAILLWYIVAKHALSKINKRSRHNLSYLLESVVSTFVVQLIVLMTGGVGSPLFFLLLLHVVALAFFLPLFVVLGFSLINVLLLFAATQNMSGFEQIFLFLQFEVSLLTALFLKDMHQEKVKKPPVTLSAQAKVIKDDVYYFFSLMAKNHFATIRRATEDFTGDHHLKIIDKAVHELEKLFRTIEKKS